MSPNLPKLTALLVNYYGLFIFRNPMTCIVHPYSTLIPSLIFALGVYLFAIDITLFKFGYRKIFIPCQFVFEFLATVFILELALLDFWFPLEKFALSQLQAAADLLKIYHCFGMNTTICCYIYTVLRSPCMAITSSYCLSSFFLCCIMQGTNVVDFKILRCGIDVFMQSLIRKIRRGMQNMWPYKGMKLPSVSSRSNRCADTVGHGSEVHLRRSRKR